MRTRALWLIIAMAAGMGSGLAAGLPLSGRATANLHELDTALDSTVHGWRFAKGDIPGAEATDFDDSAWQVVDAGHRWWPRESKCWFRKRLRLPERVNGVPVKGAALRLKLGMDNEADAYVNGELKQHFEWWKGEVLLTEDARPGQEFVIALRGINHPGYGRLLMARLESSAAEPVQSRMQALLEGLDYLEKYLPGGGLQGWVKAADEALARLDLSALETGDAAGLAAVLDGATRTMMAAAGDVPARLDRAQERSPGLERLLDEARGSGLEVDYQRATERVVESFIQYGRDDYSDGTLPRRIRATHIAWYLEGALDRAIREARAILADPSLDVKIPRYRTGPVEISEGVFRQAGRPVFFTGVGHFGQVRHDIPILKQYGLNIIQIEMGPSGCMPAPGVLDVDAIRENVVKWLDLAAQNDVSVNLLVSPHYFPRWAIERNPELGECGRGFIRYCIDAPEAREIMEKWLRALMPLIAHHPALHSICLSNEPAYQGKCKYSIAMFHQWLRRRHGSIQNLDRIYGYPYRSFEEIVPPENPERGPLPLRYDWDRFNQDRFLDWHRWMGSIIHEYDPAVPIHAKVMSQAFDSPDHFADGIDHEGFARLGRISGNDCVQMYNAGDQDFERSDGEYAQTWVNMAANYALQRSCAPGNPIFNSENHLVADGDPTFVPGSHIYTAHWQEAVRGQGASTMWVWERGQQGDLSENVLTRPDCVEALGRVALDLQRFAPYIAALRGRQAQVAVLYARSSLAADEQHGQQAVEAVEGLTFLEAPFDFITEGQAQRGGLSSYRLVLVPSASHVEDGTAGAFVEYLRGGGTVVAAGDCMTRDEYGRRRSDPLAPFRIEPGSPEPAGKVLYFSRPLSGRAWRDVADDAMDLAGCDRPLRLMRADGAPAWGVDIAVARSGGKFIVSLVNLAKSPQRVIFLRAPLPEERSDWGDSAVAQARSITAAKTVEFPLELEPLRPVLLEIPAQEP